MSCWVTMYKLQVLDKSKKLSELKKRLNNLPWDRIGRIARRSILHNFDAGGRPKKFRREHVKPWPILYRSGKLKRANAIELIPNGTSIVNRLKYQAVHNYGYPPRNIMKNEYLLLQEQDKNKMVKVFSDHLMLNI